MSSFTRDIVDLLYRQDYKIEKGKEYYTTDYKNKNYNKVLFFIEKPYYSLTITQENIEYFILEYITILIKHNKINKETILSDNDNSIDKNKVYEQFLYNKYLFDIMNQCISLYNVSVKVNNIFGYRKWFNKEYSETAENISFDIKSFDNEFYKILLTTDKLTDSYKKIFINKLYIDENVIMNDLLTFAIVFYNSTLSLEEFVNNNKFILNNYKFIVYVICYINNYAMKKYLEQNIDNYNKYDYFETYLIVLYREFINYICYNNLLNYQTDNNLHRFSYILDYDIITNAYSKEPEMFYKTVIYSDIIYNTIHNKFNNNRYYISVKDFVKKCTKFYNDKSGENKNEIEIIKHNINNNFDKRYNKIKTIINKYKDELYVYQINATYLIYGLMCKTSICKKLIKIDNKILGLDVEDDEYNDLLKLNNILLETTAIKIKEILYQLLIEHNNEIFIKLYNLVTKYILKDDNYLINKDEIQEFNKYIKLLNLNISDN